MNTDAVWSERADARVANAQPERDSINARGLYPAAQGSALALLAAGAILGALGDALLYDAGPPGLNWSVCIASVAVAALALSRHAGLPLDRTRLGWLMVGTAFAAGLAWRDAPALKLLALGSATLAFAIAAHRPSGSWVYRAGVLRYARALALGALHAWTAGSLALVDAMQAGARAEARQSTGRRQAAAVARGLLIAAPLLAVFGALFMSADTVFATLVTNSFRFDLRWTAENLVLFSILAWISTGYLRGFLTGTELLGSRRLGLAAGEGSEAHSQVLGTIEVATVIGAMNVLFLGFLVVQFRYLFGNATIVQITPGLTYADYARRGFFELVFAVVLVTPVLLAMDWLLGRREGRDALIFRALAGMQIGLVLAIAVSALQRLRLYYVSYGFTEARLNAMVLLLWISATLLWLAATVLRGRRDRFAFGALASGLVTLALLFVINPDNLIARMNVARMSSADVTIRFDVAYATSLSGDAVPLLLEALPALPNDAQCPIARHMLRRWASDREQSARSWSWSSARARSAVLAHEADLRAMLGPNQECVAPK